MIFCQPSLTTAGLRMYLQHPAVSGDNSSSLEHSPVSDMFSVTPLLLVFLSVVGASPLPQSEEPPMPVSIMFSLGCNFERNIWVWWFNKNISVCNSQSKYFSLNLSCQSKYFSTSSAMKSRRQMQSHVESSGRRTRRRRRTTQVRPRLKGRWGQNVQRCERLFYQGFNDATMTLWMIFRSVKDWLTRRQTQWAWPATSRAAFSTDRDSV